jgi:DNA primase
MTGAPRCSFLPLTMNKETKFIGFDRLKAAINIEQVLQRYGLLEQLKSHGDTLSGPCPLHGGHNPTTFRVSLSRQCWHCFGKCNSGGSIVDFVSRKERVGIREAGLLLQAWFTPGGGPLIPQVRPPIAPLPERNAVLGFTLPRLDASHPYLKQRGLNETTIREFGLGHCQHGTLTGWIAIPIHDARGQLVAYAGRWPGKPAPGEPKYRLPRGFRKSLELFNQHRTAQVDRTEPLVVVEGFFGCLRVWQAGHHRVVALMGSQLSARQEEQLVHLAGESGQLILLFDGDAAGRRGAAQANHQLCERVSVSVAQLGDGQQPESLRDADLLTLIAKNRSEVVA